MAFLPRSMVGLSVRLVGVDYRSGGRKGREETRWENDKWREHDGKLSRRQKNFHKCVFHQDLSF